MAKRGRAFWKRECWPTRLPQQAFLFLKQPQSRPLEKKKRWVRYGRLFILIKLVQIISLLFTPSFNWVITTRLLQESEKTYMTKQRDVSALFRAPTHLKIARHQTRSPPSPSNKWGCSIHPLTSTNSISPAL